MQANLDGSQIDFKPPYQRITMRDAILEHTGIDIDGKNESELRKACNSVGVATDDSMG
jgi:lysyl-tRNA synthetase class 2